MNKIVLIANKYRNNNKKNRPYHIIISCIKLFSLIILLGILFLNYYNNENLNNNRVNRLYEVNVGKISHDKSSSVFEECPYILKYFEKNSDYNINNELINTSYEIELKNIKYSELFIEEMNTYKFGVIISNNNIKSQSSIKVFGVYNAMLIGLYLILIIIYVYVCYSHMIKEINYLNILHYIGFTRNDILKTIKFFTRQLILKNNIIQLFFIIISSILVSVIREFLIKYFNIIIIFYILNQILYYSILYYLEKKVVKKHVN